ncbi:MAG: CmcI family methyltransferase [Myxococcota bacterium]
MTRSAPIVLAALMLGVAFGQLACADAEPEEGPSEKSGATVEGGESYSPVPPVEPPLENPERMKRYARSGALRDMVRTKKDVRDFTAAWALNPDGLFANTFLGVPTIQNPNDVWITQELLSEVKPDFVVEAGTLEGGSAALWATFLEQINPEAKVITIDVFDNVTAAKDLPIVKERVEFLIGSSVDPKIVAKVRKRVAGGRVMVILDSDHREAHVYSELRAYAPMVSLGSYLIVQDTGIALPRYERWPGRNFASAGADRAVRRFLEEDRRFQNDLWRERLVLTHNPGGYLRRVR